MKCDEANVSVINSHEDLKIKLKLNQFKSKSIEPHREKTGLLPMRKQRRRSASQ